MSSEPQKDEWIRTIVPGRSFADIGGLGGSAVNEMVTSALAAGASDATLIDVVPLEHPSWKDFDERCRERGIDNYRKLQADVNSLDPSQIGAFEVVHCAGVLYHMPDPVHTILRLRGVTGRYLILNSAVVPDRITTSDGGELNLPPGCALFAPALEGALAETLRQYWSARGVELPQLRHAAAYPWIRDGEGGNDGPCWSPSSKKSREVRLNYGPWWWFFTERSLEGILQMAGFKVLDKHEAWGSRAMSYLCERGALPSGQH